jgi:hypothetical protein
MKTIPPADQSRPLRQYGAFNGLGLWTLYQREVGRFLKVWMQTVFAPVVTTLLFMTVFKLAFGDRGQLTGDFENLRYNDFLAPGLIMMAILQNAFANTSSSLVQAKFNSTHVDFLMPPLSPLELTIAFLGGAVTRALLIALIGTPMVLPVAALGTSSPRALVLYAGGAGLIGCGLMLTVWLLGFRDGGLYGAFDRLRYPLANWADFGPTGRRFINHDDHWYWKRLAIAWLWFWMWLAIPVAYSLR